ncbi:hypothetical protein PILCRDRAFT_6101 [Piloderma croceum F 1598]|uniref:Uncharacterized protein n=1 Tax=Piloderma croceum (strain F 1598) TaxID=765440 RepID=A0A0C3C475_PILCF|nr:hypothetical protein PILCRDRAFT_6101 [Piloderma croceum F 1598]
MGDMDQTCRHLHTLAFDKQVWLALMGDLEARLFLDRPPEQHLRDLTTTELINLAKRMVHGPRTWSHLSPSRFVSHQHVLHPMILIEPGCLYWRNEPKLLPGGKYVLFKNHNCRQELAVVCNFAAEMIINGQAAVIIICQHIYVDHPNRENFVEIVHFDFLTETPLLLLCAFVPKTNYDNPYFHPRVHSDIAMVGIHMTTQMLLINWKTESCIILSFSSTQHNVALVCGYIITSEPVPPSDISRISVIDIQSLAEYWMPIDSMEHWKSVAIQDILPLTSDIIHGRCYHGPGFRLSAHESPLHEGLYVIWLFIPSRNMALPDPTFCSTICRYNLSCNPQGPGVPNQLHLKSSMRTDTCYNVDRDISYAGHTEIFDYVRNRTQRVLSLPELHMIMNDNDGLVDLPDAGDHIHISAYSGALTYATHDSVVINYYL